MSLAVPGDVIPICSQFRRRLLIGVLLGLSIGCGSPEPVQAPRGPRATPTSPPPREGKKPPPDQGYAAANLQKPRRPPLETMPAERVAAIAAEPGADEIALVFVGDILLGDAMTGYLAREGVRAPFEAVAPLLQQADLAVGNHEGMIVTREDRPYPWSQRAAPGTVDGLVWAGFDAVSLANNHLRDFDDDGVRETLRHLERAGIAGLGVGEDADSARTPWIVETRGMRIAVIAGITTSVFLDPAWLDDPARIGKRRRKLVREYTHAGGRVEMGAYLYLPETLAEDVAAARRSADVVVVDLHMGVVHHRPPYDDQVRLARAAARAGADLVVGHQAHLWQPAALVERTAVVYGLGNFAFGFRDPLADEGLVARAIVSRSTRRITRVELFPLATDNANPRIAFQSKLLSGESARVALEDLSMWSERLCSTRLEVGSDRAVLRIPDPGS